MKNSKLSFVLATTLLFTSASAQVFSDLQSARTVGKDRFEVTPSTSRIVVNVGGMKADLQRDYGLQVAYGIANG